MKKWTLGAGLCFVVVVSAVMVAWAQQDAAPYFPMTKGSKWVYESSTKASVEFGGNTLNIQDSKGTITEEIVGPSDQVTNPSGVLARRSTLSEKGVVDGQERNLEVKETTHAGWVGDYLSVFQESTEGGNRKTPTEKYDPPLHLVKKTLKEGDNWEVGTIRQDKLSLTARVKVVASEDVTVPAGTFKQCLKLVTEAEPKGQVEGGGFVLDVKKGNLTSTAWYATGVGLVKEETKLSLTLEVMGMMVEFQQSQTRALQPGYQVAK